MRSSLSQLLLFFTIAVIFVTTSLSLSIFHVTKVLSASPHVVISEIQVRGSGGANDEFVELYNPTTDAVDLTGWRLSRRAASASASLTTLVSSTSGSIQPHGFFLLANPSYSGSVAADRFYTATTSGIGTNNTVILFSDAGHSIVDKVAMGTAQDAEGTATVVPGTGQSIERKAFSTSTPTSMSPGGADEFAGNGFDSDDNSQDFILRSIPNPQNSTSAIEPSPTPTPTVTPTATPSPTPPLTPTPTITPAPTEQPVPTPIIREFHFPGITITCTWSFVPLKAGPFSFFIPSPQCSTTH